LEFLVFFQKSGEFRPFFFYGKSFVLDQNFAKFRPPQKEALELTTPNPAFQPRIHEYLFHWLRRSKWKDIQMDLEMGQSLVSLDSRVMWSPL
jgi:hypothetical protein